MIAESTFLTTEYGTFKINYHEFDNESCLTLVYGELKVSSPIFLRLHSSCLFSQSFHTVDCDCNKQLQAAMQECVRRGNGVVVYQEQEGRGIGLKNKIRSMEYERVNKVDTEQAFKGLGYDKLDYRKYGPAALALKEIGCKQLLLASNDPLKIKFLENAGFDIVERVKLEYETNEIIDKYLEVKKNKLGHML